MRQTPFTVNVAALRQAPGTRQAVRRRAAIAGLAVTGSGVPSDSEVAVDAVLEGVPGAIIARGTVTAPWRGACRRCLGDAVGEVRSEVVELFEEHHDPEETYPLVGDQVDLEQLARDAVLLDLPQAPLCRDGCLGLCSTCGTDLNQGPCLCQTETGDPRWAALDALRESG